MFRISAGLAAVVSTAALLAAPSPALAAPSLALAAPSPALAASGTFTALTYNIAGLPEILSSAPTPRASATTAIGQRLAPFDIVHVQEDFNYHANLYAAATSHAYRTPTSGGAGIGSGLNTLSKFPYADGDFERVRWNSCQLDSGDCLTPKGFTFMRVRLADGAHLDLYNAHTNAGTNPGDLMSRADNLKQLTAFIGAHSAGNAVLVMADTNTRYTRAADTIGAFAADNGLTDAWVQLKRGGNAPTPGEALVCDENAVTDTCEVVDKVLYRSSRSVSLNADAYHNEHAGFLEAGSGKRLSDHYPISVKFSWSTKAAYQLSEQFGGPHGAYYNDVDAVPAQARATAISLRAGRRVDQIGLTLNTGTVLTHGGTGGTAKSLTLGGDEYVTSVKLCQGKHNNTTRIFSAQFTTNVGNTLAGGTTTSDCVVRTAPEGWQVTGFHGRSGAEVDKVGLIYTKR